MRAWPRPTRPNEPPVTISSIKLSMTLRRIFCSRWSTFGTTSSAGCRGTTTIPSTPAITSTRCRKNKPDETDPTWSGVSTGGLAMFHYMPRALGLVVIVVIGLGACAPATGTPEIIGATQAATNVPAATAAPSQAVAVNTPPTTTTLSIKSKDPSTLTYLCVCDPSTLDPALDYDSGGGQILQNTYDTLIFYNKADPNSFIPQLAVDVPSQANGGISADGKTYTFRIRTGVKFHNGDVLTPDDAAFTFQRGLLQGGVANSPQWLLFQPILGATAGPNNDIADLVDPTGSIAASGDYTALQKADTANLLGACQRVTSAIVANNAAGTLTFHLAQSWGPFLSVLANSWGSISDRAWIAANGGWDGDCHTWQKFYAPTLTDQNKSKLGSGENGTGPYMLDHWIPT